MGGARRVATCVVVPWCPFGAKLRRGVAVLHGELAVIGPDRSAAILICMEPCGSNKKKDAGAGSTVLRVPYVAGGCVLAAL